MKIKQTIKGNVQITLTTDEAEHLQAILDVSDLPVAAPKETNDTSWELWELLEYDELPN